MPGSGNGVQISFGDSFNLTGLDAEQGLDPRSCNKLGKDKTRWRARFDPITEDIADGAKLALLRRSTLVGRIEEFHDNRVAAWLLLHQGSLHLRTCLDDRSGFAVLAEVILQSKPGIVLENGPLYLPVPHVEQDLGLQLGFDAELVSRLGRQRGRHEEHENQREPTTGEHDLDLLHGGQSPQTSSRTSSET